MEEGLTAETEIKKQLTEAFWSIFVETSSEKMEMTAMYPDQAQSLLSKPDLQRLCKSETIKL